MIYSVEWALQGPLPELEELRGNCTTTDELFVLEQNAYPLANSEMVYGVPVQVLSLPSSTTSKIERSFIGTILESVLFVCTRFCNLYTALVTTAEAA